MKYHNLTCAVALLLGAFSAFAENNPPREKLLMDFGWRFAFGHATDPAKDFDHAPANEMFNYLTKTGNGRGAAKADFNDSGWRKLDLPHDWAMEAPFDPRGRQIKSCTSTAAGICSCRRESKHQRIWTPFLFLDQ